MNTATTEIYNTIETQVARLDEQAQRKVLSYVHSLQKDNRESISTQDLEYLLTEVWDNPEDEHEWKAYL
jgi:hypothetical protein